MKRLVLGILAITVVLPLALVGLAVRTVAENHRTKAIIVLVSFVYLLTGCAAVVEHPARSCHSKAMTVAAMTKCSEQYPQHLGTITDTIAQPLGILERAIQHRNHNHD